MPSRDGSDYVAADQYFRLLKKHSVKFYDTSADVEEPDSGYNDDDEDDDDESSDDLVFDDDGVGHLFPEVTENSSKQPPLL